MFLSYFMPFLRGLNNRQKDGQGNLKQKKVYVVQVTTSCHKVSNCTLLLDNKSSLLFINFFVKLSAKINKYIIGHMELEAQVDL